MRLLRASIWMLGARGDRSDIVAWAVMYALPIAIALTLTALIPRAVGLSLVPAVAVSVLVAPLGESFLENISPSRGTQPVVLVAAGVVGVVLAVTGVRTRDDRRDRSAARRVLKANRDPRT